MMNPANQPQLTASQRPADPPTLWLSLVLASVFIHLVLLILASIISTQTAKVQLELEPVAVEFVDPPTTTVRSVAPSRAIAARPGTPSSIPPSSTQVQPNVPLQSASLNQPLQPLVPLQPVKRRQLSPPPRPLQPNPTRPQPPPQPSSPSQPLPRASNSPLPQQPNPLQPSQPQPSSEPAQPGSVAQSGSSGAPTGNGAQQPGSQQPITSNIRIAEPPQGGAVAIDVSGVYETADLHKKVVSIASPKAVSIQFPFSIAPALKQGIAVEAHLDIDQYGFVQKVISIRLLSGGGAIDPVTLDDLANQIFILSSLKFDPAQDAPNGLPLKPQSSDPTMRVQIQLR